MAFVLVCCSVATGMLVDSPRRSGQMPYCLEFASHLAHPPGPPAAGNHKLRHTSSAVLPFSTACDGELLSSHDVYIDAM